MFLTLSMLIPNSILADEGTISSLEWEYEHVIDETQIADTVSISRQIDESDSLSLDRSFDRIVNIYSGYDVLDLYWFRYTNFTMKIETGLLNNTGYKLEKGFGREGTVDNGTGLWSAWFRHYGMTELLWNYFYQSLFGLAQRTIIPEWYTNTVEVEILNTTTIPVTDFFNIKYDQMENMPTYRISYKMDDTLILEEILIPAYILCRPLFVQEEVHIEESIDYLFTFTGDYQFEGDYEINYDGYRVLIKDNKNYAFRYLALEYGKADYSIDSTLTVNSLFSLNSSYIVTYKNNGSALSESIRPWWLKSRNSRIEGSWLTSFSETGTIEGVAPFQGTIQTILTRKSNENLDSFAIWNQQKNGQMIGYKDINNDGYFNLALNGSTLQTTDSIMALGIPEGSAWFGNRSLSIDEEATVYYSEGDLSPINRIIDKEKSFDREFDVIRGFDPRVEKPIVQFSWETPVQDGNLVTFEWQTKYDNNPIIFILDNGAAIIPYKDQVDLTYDYSLKIDPEVGNAEFSSTYTQSKFTNQSLLADLDSLDLSMARFQRERFLSLVDITDEAEVGTDDEYVEFVSTLQGEEVLRAQFGSSKQQYMLDGSPHDSVTSIINIVTAAGVIGDPDQTEISPRNPFISPLGDKLMNAITQINAVGVISNVNWVYVENLIITSYPTWGGGKIEHDPTYSAVYSPKYDDSDSDGENTDDTGVPGFELPLMLVVVTFLSLRQKRIRKNK